MRHPLPWLLPLVLAVGACRSGFDKDESDADASATQGDTAGEDCGGSDRCAAAPEGWDGPGLLLEGASPPACGQDLPESIDAFSELTADPAECTCGCEPAAADCGALRVDNVEPPCQGAQGSSLLPMAEQCVELGFVAGPLRGEFPDPKPAAGCTPQAEVERPAPTWGSTLRLCVGSGDQASCEDGAVCVPQAGNDGRLCVRRSGNHECPAEYPEELAAFAGHEDTRDCSCACGEPLAVTCTAIVDFYDELDCSGGELATLQTGDPNCADGDSATHARSRTPVTAGGECTPTGPGEPTGSVSPSDPVTICCET